MKKENYLFKSWKKNFLNKNIKVKNTNIGYIKRGSKIFASLHDLSINIKKNQVIQRFILLRNASVVVVPIIICNKKYFTILTKQFRIIDGKKKFEFPAGNVEDGKSPKESALNEIREELGINLKKKQLKPLYKKYIEIETSCTTSRSFYFYFILKKNKKFLLDLDKKILGEKEKGEYIKLHVQELSKIDKFNNTTIFIGKYLVSKKLKLSSSS